ncbi:hypothetical protein GQ54DRAFT_12050, partial [Martensiomyces pterosporus]
FCTLAFQGPFSPISPHCTFPINHLHPLHFFYPRLILNMRISILAAQFFAVAAIAAPVTFKREPGILKREPNVFKREPVVFKRQEIASDGGDSISGGPAAISDTDVNSGTKIDSSVISNGSEGENSFANVFGSSFTKVTSNSSNKGNININPSSTVINGNSGQTANGVGNGVGDVENGGHRRRAASVDRRGVFVGDRPIDNAVVVIGGDSFFNDPLVVHDPFVDGLLFDYPHDPRFGPPAGHVNVNHQDATIVQNQV